MQGGMGTGALPHWEELGWERVRGCVPELGKMLGSPLSGEVRGTWGSPEVLEGKSCALCV